MPSGPEERKQAQQSAMLHSVSIMLSRCCDDFMRSRWVGAPLPSPLLRAVGWVVMRFAGHAGVKSHCVAPVVSVITFISPVTRFVVGLPRGKDRDQPLLMFKHIWMCDRKSILCREASLI